MNSEMLRKIIEGAIMAAGKPVDIARLETLFEESECPPRDQIRAALEEIQADCQAVSYTHLTLPTTPYV